MAIVSTRWSTARMVNRVRKEMERNGLTFDERVFSQRGASYYFIPDGLDFTVRVSDHDQAEWGGYDITSGERHSPSAVSLSPNEMTFEQFKERLKEGIREYRDAEWVAETFGRYDEIENTIFAS